VGEEDDVRVVETEAAILPAAAVEVAHVSAEQQQAEAFDIEAAERRQQQRNLLDASAQVMVKDGTTMFRGRVLDISALGCFVGTQVRLRLKPGTPVEMTLRFDFRTMRCDASCKMIRPIGAGFLFETMDERTRLAIDALIAEFEAAR
jgi:hypothetical protein